MDDPNIICLFSKADEIGHDLTPKGRLIDTGIESSAPQIRERKKEKKVDTGFSPNSSISPKSKEASFFIFSHFFFKLRLKLYQTFKNFFVVFF